MSITFDANEVEAINDIWDWCNRQWFGTFKLGTFVREVKLFSESINSPSVATGNSAAVGFASGNSAVGNSGDVNIDVGEAAAGTPGDINLGTTNAYDVNIGNINSQTTIYSPLSMDSNPITNVADGSNNTDAANVGQVASKTVYYETVSISLADMQAVGAGIKTLTKSFIAFPAGAVLVGTICSFATIDNVGNTATSSVICGGTDNDGILAITDASTGGAAAFTDRSADSTAVRGVQAAPYFSFSGQTIALKVTTTEDLNTMTKGSVSVTVFYTIPVQVSVI